MRAIRNTQLKLTHPLLTNWLNPAQQAEDNYTRMLELEQARDKALQLLPNPKLSPRQQRALEILQRQDCLNQIYHQRCQAVQQAGLLPEQQNSLQLELAKNNYQAHQRLMIGWPSLSSSEYEALPLLLMRQNVAQQIDKQLESLKIDLSCQA